MLLKIKSSTLVQECVDPLSARIQPHCVTGKFNPIVWVVIARMISQEPGTGRKKSSVEFVFVESCKGMERIQRCITEISAVRR